MPFSTTPLAISALLMRDNGIFRSQGSWQAKALTSMTTLGGKAARSPAPWSILETGQALFEKTLSPLTDDLSWHLQLFADLFVFESLGGEQNGLGPYNLKIR